MGGVKKLRTAVVVAGAAVAVVGVLASVLLGADRGAEGAYCLRPDDASVLALGQGCEPEGLRVGDAGLR